MPQQRAGNEISQPINQGASHASTSIDSARRLLLAGVVQQPIAAGAPLDLVNNLHWTAAIEAVVLGDGGVRHQQTLRALINAGANLQLTDRQGNTPLQLAKSRGYTDMVLRLERAGKAGKAG